MYNKNCFYLKVSISDEVDCFMSGRKGKVCEDHLGNEFKSIAEMCKRWGIDRSTFYTRLNAGYTLEQALTGIVVKDHLGTGFRSIDEMCKHWGVDKSLFYRRLRLGYTLEQALTGSRTIKRRV